MLKLKTGPGFVLLAEVCPWLDPTLKQVNPRFGRLRECAQNLSRGKARQKRFPPKPCYKHFYRGNLLPFHGITFILCYETIVLVMTVEKLLTTMS